MTYNPKPESRGEIGTKKTLVTGRRFCDVIVGIVAAEGQHMHTGLVVSRVPSLSRLQKHTHAREKILFLTFWP